MHSLFILSATLLFWAPIQILACGSAGDVEEPASEARAVEEWVENPAYRDSPLLAAIALRQVDRIDAILAQRTGGTAPLTVVEAQEIIDLGQNIQPNIFTTLIRHEFGLIRQLRERNEGAEAYLYDMLQWAIMGENESIQQLLRANGIRVITLAINAATAGDLAALLGLSFANINVPTLQQGHLRPLTIVRESNEDDLRSYLFFDAIQHGENARVLSYTRTFQSILTRPINGVSALHWAAYRYHPEVFNTLLQTGDLDVNGRDTNNGQTPLMYAARYGHGDLVRTLLENPAVDLTLTDNEGNTASNWAGLAGEVEIQADIDAAPEIRALTGHGAGPEEEATGGGATPAIVDYVMRAAAPAGGCA